MKGSYTEQILFNDKLIEVVFDYNPPERGKRDKYGVQLEPDFSESVEIISVKYVDEDDIWDYIGYDEEQEVVEKLLELRHERDFDYKHGE